MELTINMVRHMVSSMKGILFLQEITTLVSAVESQKIRF